MTLHENGLYDIYGIAHVPFWQTIFFYRILYAVGFLCVVGICVYGVRWWFRRRRIQRISAWERALHDLTVLEVTGMNGTDHGRKFYFGLSAILKKYICERYNVDFSGKTDKEMVCLLREYMFSPVMLQQLVTIFEHGQTVKFAGGRVLKEAMRQDFEAAVFLVKSTIPDEKK